MASFGELVGIVQRQKMTQKDLAKKICVTIGTISNYENDQHFLDVEKLVMILYIIAQHINNSVLNILYRMTWPLIILTVKTNLERWAGACFWYWRCFSSCIFVAHLKESCLI